MFRSVAQIVHVCERQFRLFWMALFFTSEPACSVNWTVNSALPALKQQDNPSIQFCLKHVDLCHRVVYCILVSVIIGITYWQSPVGFFIYSVIVLYDLFNSGIDGTILNIEGQIKSNKQASFFIIYYLQNSLISWFLREAKAKRHWK